MADHDVAEENNADRDQSVEAEEESSLLWRPSMKLCVQAMEIF